MIEFKLLLLVIVANAAPLLGTAIFRHRFGTPLDFGLRLFDGRPLIGSHTTIRGVLLAVGCSAVAAPLLALPVAVGAIVGLAAMAGDILSSFCKRRLGIAPGGKAPGLDQLPESLLPLWAVAGDYDLPATMVLGLGLGFMLFDMAASQLLYRLKLREQPH
ncbi:MAG TPA: CDP-archaeol synthase [Mariprofundaceae bacterium]|nr:CDP-archaeol synthase [Mariprofundaceae bacterium]